jgi:hypothetical protein
MKLIETRASYLMLFISTLCAVNAQLVEDMDQCAGSSQNELQAQYCHFRENDHLVQIGGTSGYGGLKNLLLQCSDDILLFQSNGEYASFGYDPKHNPQYFKRKREGFVKGERYDDGILSYEVAEDLSSLKLGDVTIGKPTDGTSMKTVEKEGCRLAGFKGVAQGKTIEKLCPIWRCQ